MNLRKATLAQVCRMDRDNFDWGEFWFLVDPLASTVTLAKQKPGEETSESITMPRRAFNYFIDQYMKERAEKR